MINPLLQFKKYCTPQVSASIILMGSQAIFTEYFLALMIWYLTADGFKDLSGTPLGADYIAVYTAGFMTNHGQMGSIYDWSIHRHFEQNIAGYALPYIPWLYPPPFLFIACLLAFLPYLWSFGLYILASFAGYWAVMRRLSPARKEYIWAMVAFPGVYCNASNGQNGFITTSLLGAGFVWLEEQPWLAGIMLGLLVYKPQLFLAIPIVLAVAGYGRALVSTLITAAIVLAATGFSFGDMLWRVFLTSAAGVTQHVSIEQGITGWHKIQSVFSWVRMWGGNVAAAYSFQAAVGAIALLATLWIWRGSSSYAVRVAALCSTILLLTPYVMDYDLVIIAIPIAMLMREGIEKGFFPYEKILLMFLWILPLCARLVGAIHIPLTPPLIITLMGLCVLKTQSLRQKSYSARLE